MSVWDHVHLLGEFCAPSGHCAVCRPTRSSRLWGLLLGASLWSSRQSGDSDRKTWVLSFSWQVLSISSYEARQLFTHRQQLLPVFPFY